jgi:hypothetical protein
MSLNNPLPGYNLAAEFMGAGSMFLTSSNLPVSSSVVRIDFPTIAKSITVGNNDLVTTNRLSFSTTLNNLTTNNSYLVYGGQQVSLVIKTNQLYLKGENLVTSSYSIAAVLSNVPRYFGPSE